VANKNSLIPSQTAAHHHKICNPFDAIKKLPSKALEMPTKTKLTGNFSEQKPQKHTRQSTMSIIFQVEKGD